MTGPHPRDLHQRTIDTATRNDQRQYGQSAEGNFFDSQRGHKQGVKHNDQASTHIGPFELRDTSPSQEIQQDIAEIITPGSTSNVVVRPDLYGTPDAYTGDQGSLDTAIDG